MTRIHSRHALGVAWLWLLSGGSTALPLLRVLQNNNNNNDANSNINQQQQDYGASPTNSNIFRLHILHINDHHSHEQPETFSLKSSDLPKNVASNALQVSYGGFPRMAATIKSREGTLNRQGENVLKLHAGDALVGTPYYGKFRGATDAALMRTVCFDAFELGNHEFDGGDRTLANFINMLVGDNSACPNTHVLAANLQPGASSPLKPLQQKGIIEAKMIKVYAQQRVGIIGVNIKDRTEFKSNPSDGTSFADEVATVTAQVNALTSQGIDKIIVLSHLGLSKDKTWLAKIKGVDVVVGGHSHDLLGQQMGPTPFTQQSKGRAYPQIIPPSKHKQGHNGAVCVVQAQKFSHVVGHLRVEWNAQGLVTMCAGVPVIPFEPNPQASDQDKGVVSSYLTGLGPVFVQSQGFNPSEVVLRRFVPGQSVASTKALTKESKVLCNEAIPEEGKSSLCLGRTAHLADAVCNLVSQALLDQTPNADVAIQNAGGCPTDTSLGDITKKTAQMLLPISSTLESFVLTGAQIRMLLEEAVQMAYADDGSTSSYPYAAGLRFNIALGAGMAYTISNLQVNRRLEESEWTAIDDNANYTVVTNSFFMQGSDSPTLVNEFGITTAITKASVLDAVAFINFVISRGSSGESQADEYSAPLFVQSDAGDDDYSSADITADDDGGTDGYNDVGMYMATNDDWLAIFNSTVLAEASIPREDGQDSNASQQLDIAIPELSSDNAQTVDSGSYKMHLCHSMTLVVMGCLLSFVALYY